MYKWKEKKLNKGLNRGKTMRNSFAYGVLFVALGAMVFFGMCSPQGSNFTGPQGPAAKIDGKEISFQEFNRAYQNTYQQYQRIYAEAFDPGQLRLAHSVLNNLVSEHVVYSEADRLGLMASDDEVDKQVLQIFKDEKTGKFDSERFTNVLRNNGYSEASLQEELRRGITVSRFRELLSQTAFVSKKAAELDYKLSETKLDVDYLKFDKDKVRVSVSQDDVNKFLDDAGKNEVKQYYDKNKNEFNQEKKVRARHILVAYKDAQRASPSTTRTKEEAKKRAEQLALQVKGGGADFATTASRETDETSGKTKGGDLGYFAFGDMTKEFSDVAFKLKASEVSGVVESPFGFHIIKVEAIQDAVSKSEAAATPEIARKLLEKQKRPAAVAAQSTEVLDAVKTNVGVSPILQKYGLTWQSTGPFAVNAPSVPKLGSSRAVRDAVLSLKTQGQVFPSVVDEGGSSYILKLRSITQPDFAKLDQEKVEDLAKNAAYSHASALFNVLKEKAQKQREADGNIWLNENYLALDQRTKEGT